MKKILYRILTCFCLISLIICTFLRSNFYTFSSANVKNNIDYLSSENFKGRFPGSSYNETVSDEIAKTFKSYGLVPLSNDYKESFYITAPAPNNLNCSLRIMDGNKTIKDFKLGEDFKEDLLNLKTSSIQFSKNDIIQIYQTSFSIERDGHTFLFYVTFDKEFSFRSSFVLSSPFDFAIQINTKTYSDILDALRNGYILDVNLPYKLQEKDVFNVVGKIPGYSKDLPPLILTAHFDHLGYDSLNKVYPGALDNASGVCFLLELAKSYSTLKMPKRDIIFVCLNCEEFGLLGSKEFSNRYSDMFPNAEVINFDMVGADNYPITLMEGTHNACKNSNLLNELKDICTSRDKKYEISFEDSSDHVSFINGGFDSLTVTNGDITNIHTPRDTANKISTPAIDNVYEVINKKIVDYSYNDIILFLYNKKLFIFLSIVTFILISYPYIKLVVKNKLKMPKV